MINMGLSRLKNSLVNLEPALAAIHAMQLAREVITGKYKKSSVLVSRENIPLDSYNASKMLAATLPGFFLETWLARISGSLEEEFDSAAVSALPENALLYAFHGDMLPVLVAHKFLKELDAIWIGYHGTLSYMGSFGLSYNQFPCFRYDKNLKPSALSQIQTALESEPNKRFYIFIDSGKPYFKVRKSLLKLSKSTGRPVVPVRHFSSKSKQLNGHQIPLKNSTIETRLGSLVTAESLATLLEDKALALLQKNIDAILESRFRNESNNT